MTFKTNLLTIPSVVGGVGMAIGITILSETVDSRSLVAMIQSLWVLPCLIALYILPPNPNPWSFYVRV